MVCTGIGWLEHCRTKSHEHAKRIVDEVQQVIATRWHAVLRQHGVTPAECEKLEAAFNYAGFELDPTLVLGQR